MVAGLTYDSGNYEAATEKAEQLFDTTSCAPSRPTAGERNGPRPARHRHLDVHRDVRPGAVPRARLAVVRRRRLGVGARCGCCPPARSRSSPATTRTARATTRPGARSPPTSLGVPFEDVEVIARRHRARAPRAWTPTARARWSSAASPSTRRPARWSRRPSGSPPTCSRPTRRDLEFAGGTFSVKGSPEASKTIQEVALRDVRRAQPARRHGAVARRRLRPTTRTTSPSRTAPTCARSRSTPRPGAEDPQVRLRRRRRQDHQPDDRRGPDARRPRPGHRAGAVRGGRLRRRGQPGHRHAGRLPGAGARPTCRTSSPTAPRHRRPPTRSASRASARPARSPRRRPWSTRSSTRCARSASTTSTCRARPNGSGGPCRQRGHRRTVSSGGTIAGAPQFASTAECA